jgi:hypothetical protein
MNPFFRQKKKRNISICRRCREIIQRIWKRRRKRKRRRIRKRKRKELEMKTKMSFNVSRLKNPTTIVE